MNQLYYTIILLYYYINTNTIISIYLLHNIKSITNTNQKQYYTTLVVYAYISLYSYIC